jgi:hypothetical protein
LFLLIAVLSAGFIMVGCSQSDDPVTAAGTGTSGGAGTITLKGSLTAYELANELKAYSEVTLIGDYREIVAIHDYQDGQLVPTTLHIPDNATLTVGKNVTLVFDDDRLSISEKGTLKVADGGVLILYDNNNNATGLPDPAIVTNGNVIGELIVEEGGIFFDMNPAGSLWGSGAADEGTGKLIFKAGSKVYTGGGADTYYPTGFTAATGSTGTTGFGSYDLTSTVAKQANRIGTTADATLQLQTGEFILTKDTFELNGEAVVNGQYDATPANTRYFGNGGGTLTIQLDAGSTATLANNVALNLSSGAPIIGEGKLVVAKTEIVGGAGGWWAVTSTPGTPETIVITALTDRTSSITVASSAPVFRGAAGATITQKIGLGSILTIGGTDAGVLNLGGTVVDNTPVAGAQLILEGDPNWTATNNIAGSVLFGNTGSSLVGGLSAGIPITTTNVLTTASKIGGKTIAKLPGVASTVGIHTDTQTIGGTAAPGHFRNITVTTANDGISSGSIEDLVIDSTQLVE